MTGRTPNQKRVNCFRCRFFYVTWDNRFPRGCRAMGFKTREMPGEAVLAASGMACLKFEEKRRQGR